MFYKTLPAVNAVPLYLLSENTVQEWLSLQSAFCQTWVNAQNFSAKKGTVLCLPDETGKLTGVLIGLINADDIWALARAASVLPEGEYTIHTSEFSPFYLSWGLEQYRFTRYKSSTKIAPKYLAVSAEIYDNINLELSAMFTVRDAINTPAQDMNPETLEELSRSIANKYGATFSSIVGDDLLKHNFPAIHAVGRASAFEPRLLEFTWGNSEHPAVTLVGKGVCFDTGGLDLKSASGMLLMKKDMSGAAQVLGLAILIMANQLPVNLRVLIPAVENSVSGNAYRPGDVLATRKGLTIAVGNTDAEGRVILSDALAYAMETPPNVLIDIASLTGVAGLSLGYDLASFFTPSDALASSLQEHTKQTYEGIWRMPLHWGYKESIEPEIADLMNTSSLSYAGSITAALFLESFVETAKNPNTTWAHFDTTSWNDRARPGRPVGGQTTVIRSLYAYLAERFLPKNTQLN